MNKTRLHLRKGYQSSTYLLLSFQLLVMMISFCDAENVPEGEEFQEMHSHFDVHAHMCCRVFAVSNITCVSAVFILFYEMAFAGCESLSPLTSACHGHGTCLGTLRNGQMQHVCVCDDGYMSVGDFVSAHDTGARCLLNKRVVRGLFSTYFAAVCVNLLLAARHLILAYIAHHAILTAKLQSKMAAVASHRVSALEVFQHLWHIPRIRLIAIYLFWSILHFVVCILRLFDEPQFDNTLDASTQLTGMNDLTPLPQLLDSGQMIGHNPGITILWALCSFIYFNSMLYASFQLLVAFQANAAAVAAKHRAHNHQLELMPKYTYCILFPLSAISFLLIVIPLGDQSTMQPTVIAFWCGVALGCSGWALVYWRAAAALAKHVDDSAKATAELRGVTVVESTAAAAAAATATAATATAATSHHRISASSPGSDVISQLSRRLRVTSIILPAMFFMLASVQILVAAWPLLRATSVYIMCISWTIGSVISVGIMFLFDVALQEDRRKARQVFVTNHEVETTTTHTSHHATKSNTIAISSSVQVGGHLPHDQEAAVLTEPSPNENEIPN